MSLQLPIAPGRYRTSGGEVAEVKKIDRRCLFPVLGVVVREMGSTWAEDGSFRHNSSPDKFDLVSRIEDEPHEPNPLIAPLEWALAQMEPSMDPDWQAAYKAATEALKLAKQK